MKVKAVGLWDTESKWLCEVITYGKNGDAESRGFAIGILEGNGLVERYHQIVDCTVEFKVRRGK